MCDILLVEDNEYFRRTLYDSLSNRFPNADIRAVKTGEEAIESCARRVPRIVLLDIGLSGINGLQAMERIRSRNTTIRIVVVTGSDAPEYREAARLRGADYFVSKNTVRLEELLALTGGLIDEKEPAEDVAGKFRMPPAPDSGAAAGFKAKQGGKP